MKTKIAIVLSVFLFCTHIHAQLTLKDIFGRNLSGQTITLVDWEGYMANPAIKLTLKSPSFPLTVTVSANSPRLYFDMPSTTGSGGPTKTISFSNSNPIDFYISIFPDRASGDEDYTLTFNSSYGTQTFAIHVVDQDSPSPVINYNIQLDYSQDKPAYNFYSNSTYKTIVRQAADDWAFFLNNMNFDDVPSNSEQTYIWNDDFGGGSWISNSNTYNGFLLYVYGLHTSPHRSGGEGSTDGFQTIGGVQTGIRKAGGFETEAHGNYNTLGWNTGITDNTWYQATNMINTQNDLYSVAMHEMGHALNFNQAYPAFLTYKTQGYINAPAVVAYQGTTAPIDASEHISNGQASDALKFVDRISKKGSFGSEYANVMPYGRWMITKLSLLSMQAIGYSLKTTSAFKNVAINNSSFSAGNPGVSYTTQIAADGGIPFYKYEVLSGSLPTGLSLNSFTGKITGVPTVNGVYNFTIRVTDYDNQFIDKALSIKIQPAIVTPVVLENFSVAMTTNCENKIKWKTSSEVNTIQFIIESSDDGINFTRTTIVTAAKKPDGSSYEYLDPVKHTGKKYYRLRIEDAGGGYNYSKILYSNSSCSSISSIVISPNPVSEMLTISNLPSTAATINIYSASGQIQKTISVTGKKENISVSKWTGGMYTLHVLNASGTEIETRQILKIQN